MNEQKEPPIQVQELEDMVHNIEEADLILAIGAELNHLIPEKEVNMQYY